MKKKPTASGVPRPLKAGHLLENIGLFSCQSILFRFLAKNHVGTDKDLQHVEFRPLAPLGGALTPSKVPPIFKHFLIELECWHMTSMWWPDSTSLNCGDRTRFDHWHLQLYFQTDHSNNIMCFQHDMVRIIILANIHHNILETKKIIFNSKINL